MKKHFIRYLSTFLLFIFPFIFSCKQHSQESIRVGVIAGPEAQLAQVAKEVAKRKFNLNIQITEFQDYDHLNEQLDKNKIDVNVFQHLPFLQEESEKHGYKFVAVGNTFVFPVIAFSKAIHNIADLQSESVIAIPNDPTNRGRALLLLHREGIISLKPDTGLHVGLNDITENPKKIKFLEMDADELPKALNTKKAVIAIINNSFSQNGINPEKDALFAEDKDSPYVNLIVTKVKNKNSLAVQQFIQSYQSEEVEKKAAEIFHHTAIKNW